MRLVISLGGSAFLRKNEEVTAENYRENASRAAMWLSPVIRENETIITLGGGPQLGMLVQRPTAHGPIEMWSQ